MMAAPLVLFAALGGGTPPDLAPPPPGPPPPPDLEPLPEPVPLPLPWDEPTPPPAGAGETRPARSALRLTAAAGTSDLGGLGNFRPALNGRGDVAGRLGATLESWVEPRLAFAARLAVVTETGAHDVLGNTYYYRRAVVLEPALMVSVVRAGPVDLVAAGGLGIALLEEGSGTTCPAEAIDDCPGPELRGRVGPSLSLASGLLVTAGPLSVSLLARLASTGGRTRLHGPLPEAWLDTYGVSVTGELGAGLAW